MLPPDEPTQDQEQVETAPGETEQKPGEEQAEESEENAEAKGDEAEGDGEESEEEEAKGEDDKAGDVEPGEKHKRTGWQRQRQKIERLERQNQLLVEQLSSQRPETVAAPKPDKDKTPEDKAAEFIGTLVQQEIAKRETQQRQQTALAEFQRRAAEVRVAHPDFDEVVASVAHMRVPTFVNEALLTSEHGPAIMYQLAESPAELARLGALPPLDAAREIGRLEAKFAAVAPPRKTSGTAKRPPAPPTSVNGKKSSTRSLENLPISEYKRAYRSGRR